MAADDVVVEPGDMLLLHTGFATKLLEWDRDPDPAEIFTTVPYLDAHDEALLDWIADSQISALVADNYAVEGLLGKDRDPSRHSFLPIHHLCLFKLGVPLGELWYLHELAAWLRDHDRSRFLLTAPPLRLPGIVGSPLTPSPPSDTGRHHAGSRSKPCRRPPDRRARSRAQRSKARMRSVSFGAPPREHPLELRARRRSAGRRRRGGRSSGACARAPGTCPCRRRRGRASPGSWRRSVPAGSAFRSGSARAPATRARRREGRSGAVRTGSRPKSSSETVSRRASGCLDDTASIRPSPHEHRAADEVGLLERQHQEEEVDLVLAQEAKRVARARSRGSGPRCPDAVPGTPRPPRGRTDRPPLGRTRCAALPAPRGRR